MISAILKQPGMLVRAYSSSSSSSMVAGFGKVTLLALSALM
jgi:hypothetical protein